MLAVVSGRLDVLRYRERYFVHDVREDGGQSAHELLPDESNVIRVLDWI